MQVILIANEQLSSEFIGEHSDAEMELKIVQRIDQIDVEEDAVIIDLLFEQDADRIQALINLLPCTIIVSAVAETLSEIHSSFIRINGWPGFLKAPVVEACSLGENQKPFAEKVFKSFHKNIQWLPDQPGLVSARVVASIIHEAHLAFAEGVSTKEEIDTAMKLGTNYPMGPFEWEERIGRERVAALIKRLGKD